MNVRLLIPVMVVTGLWNVTRPESAYGQESTATVVLENVQYGIQRLAPGQTSGEMTFQVDPASTASVEIISDVAGLVTSIVLPSSVVLEPTNILNSGGNYIETRALNNHGSPLIIPVLDALNHYLYTFPVVEVGVYKVRVQAPASLAGEAFAAAEVRTDSDVKAKLFATEARVVAGETAVLGMALFDGSQPIVNQIVNVIVSPPAGTSVTLQMADTGNEPDTAAGDGLYSVGFVPAAVGDYTFVASVAGVSRAGAPFRRQSAARIEVVAPSSVITGSIQDFGVDDNADGLINRVVVSFSVNTIRQGTYLAHIVLETASGKTIVASAQKTLSVGVSTVEVSFDADQFLAVGEAGPYSIEMIELRKIEDNGDIIPASVLPQAGQTRAYALSAFQRAKLFLTNTITDQAFDDNSNGRFDRLVVGVGVSVLTPGSYSWSMKLTGAGGREIAFAVGSGLLTAGTNNLIVTFQGSAIGNSGLNGPYLIRDLLLYGPPGASLVTVSVGQTKTYTASQFERTISPADLNSDGLITPTDFQIFRAAMASCFGQASYLARADYDDDGCVTLIDYQRFLLFYNAR